MKKLIMLTTILICPVLAQGEWEFTASLPYSVDEAEKIQVNDSLVIFVGGFDLQLERTDYIQLCNLRAETCILKGHMPFRVVHPAVIDLENGSEIMIAGGFDPDIGSAPATRYEVNIFNYFTGECTETGSTQIARSFAKGTVLNNGNVLIAFGGGGARQTYEIWDLETEEWFFLGYADCNKQFPALIKRNELIYVIGNDEKGLVFDEQTYSWSLAFEFEFEWESFGLSLDQDNNILMSSGYQYEPSVPYTRIAAIVNPDIGEITMIDSVNHGSSQHAQFCVDNGDCYKVGGYRLLYGGPLYIVEKYSNNEWTQVESMPTRYHHAFAGRLFDGRYFVTGDNRYSGGVNLIFSWNNKPSIGAFQCLNLGERSYSVNLIASDPDNDLVKVCLFYHGSQACSEYQESGSTFEFYVPYEWGSLTAQAYDIWSESGIHNSISDLTELMVLSNDDFDTPTEFILNQNYPNPFNPETLISYELPLASDVQLIIYDLRGQEVARLVNTYQFAGKHQVTWNATSSPTGIYMYRLITEEKIYMKKMTLLR